MTPHVSVIIPTHNRADFLLHAIGSVLAQGYTDYEIIVADDGSTDETAARVAALPAPIRLLRLPHSGRPSVVRNRALAAARGELVAFLDDDDLWCPDKLARQVALLDGDATLGLVYSDVRLLFEDGTRSAPVLKPQQKRGGFILADLLADCFIHPSSVLLRRDYVEQVGGFDETLASAEDYDLWVRLAPRAKVGVVAEPLVLVRRHPAEISVQREQISYQSVIHTLERVRREEALPLRQRLILRRALAQRYTHWGGLLLRGGERERGRALLWRGARLYPLQRRPWQLLAMRPPRGA